MMLYYIIGGYLVLINLITFLVRGIDKRKARKGKWRISEKQLLILVGLGGFVGGILGMQMFRHKTIKSKFLYYFWGIVLVWLVGLSVLLYQI